MQFMRACSGQGLSPARGKEYMKVSSCSPRLETSRQRSHGAVTALSLNHTVGTQGENKSD